MTRLLPVLVTAMSFVACATGTELLTDKAYPAIEDSTTVSILTEMPEGAEQIAILKASSVLGSSQWERWDNVVETLKRRAAKLGANAVVLIGQDTTIWHGYPGIGGSGLGGYGGEDKDRLEAVAIFVN